MSGRPTCEECEYLFPNACSSGKASESDDDSSEDGEGDSSAKRDVSSNTKDDSSDNDDSSGVSKNGEFGFFNDTEAELDSITDGFAYVPFEYAPDEWKALFVDEYAANDDVVVSLVNVILQFGDEIERVNKVAVIDVFSLVSAVEPSQVDILHMYDNSKTYTLEAGNTTETVIDNLVTVRGTFVGLLKRTVMSLPRFDVQWPPVAFESVTLIARPVCIAGERRNHLQRSEIEGKRDRSCRGL